MYDHAEEDNHYAWWSGLRVYCNRRGKYKNESKLIYIYINNKN